MRKTTVIFCLLMFVCTLSLTAAWSEEKKPEGAKEASVMPTKKEKDEAAKQVDLFYRLVAYGEAQKSPLILVSAVKLLDDLSFAKIAKPGQDKKGTDYYDRVALLDQAKEYAAGDTDLLGVIAKLKDPPEQTDVRGIYIRFTHPYHHHHWGCVWHRYCDRWGRCWSRCD